MNITADRDKLAELKKSLWRANDQAREIQELAGRLVARNNELIWQVYCLAEEIEPDGTPWGGEEARLCRS